jgi:hypothetical protein
VPAGCCAEPIALPLRRPASCSQEPAAAAKPAVQVSAGLVKQLRDKSGAGMMDCKKALAENNGDIEVRAELMWGAGSREDSRLDPCCASCVGPPALPTHSLLLTHTHKHPHIRKPHPGCERVAAQEGPGEC